MERRIPYLDYLKIVAIFLVVYTHFTLLSGSRLGHITHMATYAGVPLFFMVNGALLLNKRTFCLRDHLKKMGHILLVFLFWKIAMVVICGAVQGEKLFPWSASEFLNYMLGYQSEYYPTEAFWFFVALLQVYLIFPLFKVIFDSEFGEKIIFYCCVLLFACSFLPKTIEFLLKLGGIFTVDFSFVNLYKPFGSYANQLLLFLLGGILHKRLYIEKRYIVDGKRAIFTVAVFALNLALLYVCKGLSSGFTGDTYGGIPSYSLIFTLFMAVAVFILFSQIPCLQPTAKWLCTSVKLISSNTLMIYILHLLIGRLVRFYFYESIPWRGVMANSVKTLLLIFVSVLCCEGLKRIPFIRAMTHI